MKPPTSGPTIVDRPYTAPSKPCRRGRDAGGNERTTAIIASVSKPPPPAPCRPRARTSSVMSRLNPHSAEPVRNTPTATSSTGRVPCKSASLP